MIKGFHEPSSLPFKQGETVLIPKGTVVKTTHPNRDSYVLKRNQRIVIHHLGCGMSYSVGHKWNNGEKQFQLFHREDERTLNEVGYVVNDSILEHPDATERRINDSYSIITVPVMNPTVVWAGAGGYWCEVDVNLVKKVEE